MRRDLNTRTKMSLVVA